MKTLNFSSEDIDKMLDLGVIYSQIFNEGSILKFYDKDGSAKIFKRFHKQEGLPFSNKLYTINTLIDNSRKVSMDEIVFPEHLVSVDRHIEGFSMPFVDGPTLYELLKDKDIDISKKTEYLSQIGTILRKMKYAQVIFRNGFYLNDLHEKNFVLDTASDRLKAIDMDSCSIENSFPSIAKYLTNRSPLIFYPDKYQLYDKQYSDLFKPSEQTDLYCYAILVLNYLSNAHVEYWLVDEFYDYLEYLINIGADSELVDAFSKIYSKEANVNLEYLLESIPYIYKDSSRETFLSRTKRK